MLWATSQIANGRLPAPNEFYQADTDRVIGNLTGTSENYYRFKVHPLYGWVCIVAQYGLTGAGHMSRAVMVLLTTSVAAIATAALLYAVLRRFESSPLKAFGFTALYISTGASVAWCSVPEIHLFGAASVLLTILIVRPGTEASPSRFRRALGFVTSFSMVVTNAMLWVLEQIDFDVLRAGDLRAFLLRHWVLIRQRLPVLGIGLVLLFALWALQWPFLHKRLGIPFNFLEEHNYIRVAAASPFWTLNTLGYAFPGALGSMIGVVATALTAATLAVLPRRLWFIPLFALFGVALHAVYGSDSAFLFSPNYAPASVAALALAADRVIPRWGWLAAIAAAAALATFNLHSLSQAFHDLAAAGKLNAL
jgi:hypothetical protein